MDELRVAQGTYLAAGPDMLDPNFRHTVVLICQHDEHGAYGLVVNRPTPRTCDELLPEHPVLGQHAFPVHQGGPVGLDTMQVLHRAPKEIPGGVPIDGELWLGGDLDAVGGLLVASRPRALRRLRLLVGYSGWGAGQLEHELECGAWLPVRPKAAAVFAPAVERLWRDVVRDVGGPSAGFEDQPPDPTWN